MGPALGAAGGIGRQMILERHRTAGLDDRRPEVAVQWLQIERRAPAGRDEDVVHIQNELLPELAEVEDAGAIRGGSDGVGKAVVAVDPVGAAAAHAAPAGVEAAARRVDAGLIARAGINAAKPVIHVPAVVQAGRPAALGGEAGIIVGPRLNGGAVETPRPAEPPGQHPDRAPDADQAAVAVEVAVVDVVTAGQVVGAARPAMSVDGRVGRVDGASAIPAGIDPDFSRPVEDVDPVRIPRIDAMRGSQHNVGFNHGPGADEVAIHAALIHKTHQQLAVHAPGKIAGGGDARHVAERGWHQRFRRRAAAIRAARAATAIARQPAQARQRVGRQFDDSTGLRVIHQGRIHRPGRGLDKSRRRRNRHGHGRNEMQRRMVGPLRRCVVAGGEPRGQLAGGDRRRAHGGVHQSGLAGSHDGRVCFDGLHLGRGGAQGRLRFRRHHAAGGEGDGANDRQDPGHAADGLESGAVLMVLLSGDRIGCFHCWYLSCLGLMLFLFHRAFRRRDPGQFTLRSRTSLAPVVRAVASGDLLLKSSHARPAATRPSRH